MKIKELLPQINPQTFIDDYLCACGVEDVELWKKPNKSCLDKLEDYENIKEVYEILRGVIKDE